MASIYKRKDTETKKGKPSWRAVIRIKGYPTVSKTSDRKQELIDWAQETERQIKSGQFNFDHYKNQHTFDELVDRYIQDGILEHHRSAADTKRHLIYWKSRLGAYAVVHINTALLSKERQHLSETPTSKGSKRTTATTNRYMSSLSSLLSYAVSHLNWLKENPALRLKKLKESRGRDRVLSEDEITRLLSAAKESKSPYLYCMILLSLTTGAGQRELLGLEWKDIDFENEIAFIRESKNGHPRSIALCKPVLQELHRFHENRNPHKPLVFASKTAFGRVDLKKAWQNAVTRAGITN